MESLKKRWDEWVISLKKNKTEASGDKHAKTKYTQIVYVVGPSGTGKVSMCSSPSYSYFYCCSLLSAVCRSVTSLSLLSHHHLLHIHTIVIYWRLHAVNAWLPTRRWRYSPSKHDFGTRVHRNGRKGHVKG